MHEIDGHGHINGRFTEGSPADNVPATRVTAGWLNMLQGELLAVAQAAGIVPDKANNGQLIEALNLLFGGGGGSPGNIGWGDIENKPTLFPPDDHAHDIAIADVEDLQAVLDEISGGGGTVSWSGITGKPSSFPPSNHSHSWASVTGKPASFTPSSHSHSWADITGKPTSFAPSGHGHAISDVTGLQAALNDLQNNGGSTVAVLTQHFYSANSATFTASIPSGFSASQCKHFWVPAGVGRTRYVGGLDSEAFVITVGVK